jgi:DHA2 family multidrug resistance protein
MNLDTDGSHFRWIRAIQGFGYGLFLVPVNLIAYSQLRPDQNNKPSSLTNLFRKWGGSFGIAFVTTATERRAELHQLNLGSHLGSSSQTLHDNSAGLIQQLTQYGLSSADAGTAKLAVFYRELLHQSEFLASMDCFRVFAWLSLVIFPFRAIGSPVQGWRSTNCRPLSGHLRPLNTMVATPSA